MDIVSAKKVFNKMAIPQFSSISVKNDFEILVKESNLSYVAVLLQKYWALLQLFLWDCRNKCQTFILWNISHWMLSIITN